MQDGVGPGIDSVVPELGSGEGWEGKRVCMHGPDLSSRFL